MAEARHNESHSEGPNEDVFHCDSVSFRPRVQKSNSIAIDEGLADGPTHFFSNKKLGGKQKEQEALRAV